MSDKCTFSPNVPCHKPNKWVNILCSNNVNNLRNNSINNLRNNGRVRWRPMSDGVIVSAVCTNSINSLHK